MKKMVCLLSFIIIPFCILAQRVSYSLNDSWLFFKGQANVMTPTDNWQEVTLPHSWNMEDGQYSGKNRLDDNGHAQIQRGDTVSIVDPAIKFGYYRGVGWYARIINIPVEWEKNVFLYVLKQQVKLPVCMLMGRCWGNIEGPLPLFVTN